MPGYSHDFSKSNNAHQAEREGRMTASALASALGISTETVRGRLYTAEYHHTSKWFNETLYYDEPALIALADGREPTEDELAGNDFETTAEARARLNELRAETATRKAAREDVTEWTGCTVTWLEWSGSRRHPRATKMHSTGCRVTRKGSAPTVTVTADNGPTMRKSIDTRGFEVVDTDGKTIRF